MPVWLEGRGGQPEGDCHRQMLDAVFYATDNGVKWRSVPVDFPAWDRGYAFFRRWRRDGLVKELYRRLRGETRGSRLRAACGDHRLAVGHGSRLGARVLTWYNGGKKINGRRRHVVRDSLGLLLMILVTAGDDTDRQAARAMLPRLRTRFQQALSGVG